MAIKIEMPKLSDTMEEGVIAKWNVKEGDKIEAGDIIAEVETDKATMDVEAFDSGTLLKIIPGEGDAVPLGGLIAVIGEEGEDISALLESGDSPSDKKAAPASSDKAETEAVSEVKEEASSTTSSDSGRVKASPLAKKIAEDKGIDLAESKFSNPHFYETVDVDMKSAIAARSSMNAANDVKISFNDIVVKACAVALTRHQAINSSWHDDVIVEHADVNIAVAVAIDEGLMTPVINHVDQKGFLQISSETRELAGLARDRKLAPEQMEGSTFTISNLGMFGIEEFTAIINPPNACILAVGAIRDVPVVENGAVVPGKRMKITLSSDHRIVDGAKAAKFLNEVRTLLENPISMLL